MNGWRPKRYAIVKNHEINRDGYKFIRTKKKINGDGYISSFEYLKLYIYIYNTSLSS